MLFMKGRVPRLPAIAVSVAGGLLAAGCSGESTPRPDASAAAPAAARQKTEADGDALVAGTGFNATATVRCITREGEAVGDCDAGIVRNRDGTARLTVFWPDGRSRNIMFDTRQRAAGADTSEADGSSAYALQDSRAGDVIVVTIGPERYEIPEVLVLGD